MHLYACIAHLYKDHVGSSLKSYNSAITLRPSTILFAHIANIIDKFVAAAVVERKTCFSMHPDLSYLTVPVLSSCHIRAASLHASPLARSSLINIAAHKIVVLFGAGLSLIYLSVAFLALNGRCISFGSCPNPFYPRSTNSTNTINTLTRAPVGQ